MKRSKKRYSLSTGKIESLPSFDRRQSYKRNDNGRVQKRQLEVTKSQFETSYKMDCSDPTDHIGSEKTTHWAHLPKKDHLGNFK